MALTMVFNLYLNIQYKINSYGDEDNIGTIISYFSLNITSVFLFTYFILLFLKLQNIIDYHYATIAIPIYIIYGVSLFYFVFIFPALYDANLYFEIILVFNYLIESFIAFLLLNSRNDNNSQIYYSLIFIPIWLALALHFAYITYSSLKEERILIYFSSFFTLIIIICASVLLCFKFDNGSKIENWFFGILLIISYLIYATDQIIHIYIKKEEEHENDEKKEIMENNINDNKV